jgi:hypothetical protein
MHRFNYTVVIAQSISNRGYYETDKKGEIKIGEILNE